MNEQEFWTQLYAGLPHLEGKLHLVQVEYYETRKKAVAYFTSDVLIGAADFSAIRKALQQSFPRISISLRVASPQLAEDFLTRPEQYTDVIEKILVRHYPAMSVHAGRIRWLKAAGDGLLLEMPSQFAYEYMNKIEVKDKLRRAIFDIFQIAPDISLSLAENIDERVAYQVNQRQREQQLLEAVPQPEPAPPFKVKERKKKI